MKNRFFLRKVYTGKPKRGATRPSQVILYDYLTDEDIGEPDNDLPAMVQQLRSLRAKHHEPLDTPALYEKPHREI